VHFCPVILPTNYQPNPEPSGRPRRLNAFTSLVGVKPWWALTLALDWPQYSKGKYGYDQRAADQTGRGIGKGSYVEPWLYRVCIRANGIAANCPDVRALIQTNSTLESRTGKCYPLSSPTLIGAPEARAPLREAR
jgi:hypothetical protein